MLQESLLKENVLLSNTVKKLNRDVAKVRGSVNLRNFVVVPL